MIKIYVVHSHKNLQVLQRVLRLKKVHRVIQFNQEAWIKSYNDINNELIKKPKNDFEKDFSNLINNAVFGKTMEKALRY